MQQGGGNVKRGCCGKKRKKTGKKCVYICVYIYTHIRKRYITVMQTERGREVLRRQNASLAVMHQSGVLLEKSP